MPIPTTTYLGLGKPTYLDPADVAELNTNMDKIDLLRRAIGVSAPDPNRMLYLGGLFTGTVASYGVAVGPTLTAPTGGQGTVLYVDGIVETDTVGSHGVFATVAIQPNFVGRGATVDNLEGLVVRAYAAPPFAGVQKAVALVLEQPSGGVANYSLVNSGVVQMRGASAISWQITEPTEDGLMGAATGANAYVPGSATGDFVWRVATGRKLMLSADGGGTAHWVMQSTGLTLALPLTLPGGATLLTTTAALTNGAGAGAGTLTNAPSAGNPTKWIAINDGGTVRRIPSW